MLITPEAIIKIILALVLALVVSFLLTPPVKAFAKKVGAIDVPKDDRRVHKTPIPRLGGLAIFLGFVISVVCFAHINRQIQGILLGSVVVVIVGVIDDIVTLRAWQKFLLQIAAALIAVYHGVVVEVVSNPNVFSAENVWFLGKLSIPLTILWIVAVTNAVNLIDGLDGLAVGVSTISAIIMLIIAILLSNGNIAIILAALAGACIGFMPYNLNPAKIFMGDTGALLLGYLLSTLSIVGLFKFYAIISFFVPFLVLALPLIDTAFAFFRRLLRGQNPMKPDREHFHHKLLDRGFNQRQAVFVIYIISGFLGMLAVVITTKGELRIVFTTIMLVAALVLGIQVRRGKLLRPEKSPETETTEPEEDMTEPIETEPIETEPIETEPENPPLEIPPEEDQQTEREGESNE